MRRRRNVYDKFPTTWNANIRWNELEQTTTATTIGVRHAVNRKWTSEWRRPSRLVGLTTSWEVREAGIFDILCQSTATTVNGLALIHVNHTAGSPGWEIVKVRGSQRPPQPAANRVPIWAHLRAAAEDGPVKVIVAGWIKCRIDGCLCFKGLLKVKLVG